MLVIQNYPILYLIKLINTIKFMAENPLRTRFLKLSTIENRDAKIWEDEENYKTSFYESIDPEASIFLDYVVKKTNINDRILDICCNQGRFLFGLLNRNYQNLYGFDIMKPAIDKLINNPKFDSKKIEVKNVMGQEYLRCCDNEKFDWAITYSATIELMHPQFNIFEHLYRVTQKGLILAISENCHAYPRFYRYIAKREGFRLSEVVKINKEINILFFTK
ncbi:AdoMet_MTases domain containing protein [Burkholderiaceae bacterium]